MNASLSARLTPMFAAILGGLMSSSTTAQVDAKPTSRPKLSDRDLVTAALRDYVEGIYQAKPERIERSVATDLVKVGITPRKNGEYRERPMTFDQLCKLAATYNKAGDRVPKDAPKRIEILGLLPKVAIGKLTAHWGIDLMQLIKTDGKWRVKHIVWQRHRKTVKTLAADRKAIAKAAENYALAFYTASPQLIDTHVDKKLAKFGAYMGREMAMSFGQLRNLAATLHKDRPAPADSPKTVEILDCNDHTAVVKLTGAWGLDFMSLIRTDAGWKIRQVIWQSHPPRKAKRAKRAK
jgi:Putative lumazine-binding